MKKLIRQYIIFNFFIVFTLLLFIPIGMSAPLDDSLIYITCDDADIVNGGTQYEDKSTNAENATIRNIFVDTDGQVNQACGFTGNDTNQRLELNNSAILDEMSSNISISFWVKPDIRQIANVDIISRHNGAFALQHSGGAIPLEFILLLRSGESGYSTGSLVLSEDVWQHVAMIKQGTNVSFYIDAVINSTSLLPNGVDIIDTNDLLNLSIGNVGDHSTNANFNGSIDEISFWNRTLNFTEVQVLALGGVPLSFVSPTPPSGTVNSSLGVGGDIQINSTCATGNVNLWFGTTTTLAEETDLVLNQIASPAVYDISTNVSLEGTYFYKGSCDVGNTNTSIRNWTYDATPPNISINIDNFFAPNNFSTISNYDNQVLFNISFNDTSTISSFNITIKRDGSSVFTLQNNSITHTFVRFANITNISSWQDGRLDIEIFVNDTNGNERSENFSWFNGNLSLFADGAFSQHQAIISINFSIDSTIDDINATLIYNGTQLAPSKTTTTNNVFFSTIVASTSVLSNQNISLSWNGYVIQGDGNTSLYNISGFQEVNHWDLDNCSVYTTIALNFTVVDELNESTISSDIDWDIDFYLTNVSLSKQFAGSISTDIGETFCITPSNATLNLNYSLEYGTSSSPERRHTTLETTASSSKQDIRLFLLDSEFGLYARFRTLDSNSNPIIGVFVRMRRIISSTLTTIESGLTDASGLVTFFSDFNNDYTFEFVKSPYTTQTQTIRPTSSDIYNVFMSSVGVSETNSSQYAGLLWSFSPINSLLQPSTTYVFTFNITSSVWDITSCVLKIEDGDSVLLASSSDSFDSAQCNIGIPFNTGTYSTIRALGIIGLNNSINITLDPWWFPHNYTKGNASLMNLIDDLSLYNSDGVGGLNSFTLALISFGLIAILTFGISRFVGIGEAEGVIVLFLSLVWAFSFIGWLILPIPSLPSGLDSVHVKQYLIFYLMFLGGIGFIVQKNWG